MILARTLRLEFLACVNLSSQIVQITNRNYSMDYTKVIQGLGLATYVHRDPLGGDWCGRPVWGGGGAVSPWQQPARRRQSVAQTCPAWAHFSTALPVLFPVPTSRHVQGPEARQEWVVAPFLSPASLLLWTAPPAGQQVLRAQPVLPPAHRYRNTWQSVKTLSWEWNQSGINDKGLLDMTPKYALRKFTATSNRFTAILTY